MLAIIRVPLELWLIIILVSLGFAVARWRAAWVASSDEHDSLWNELKRIPNGGSDEPRDLAPLGPLVWQPEADAWAARHEMPPDRYTYAEAGTASNGHRAWIVRKDDGALWATTDQPSRPEQSEDPRATWIVPLNGDARRNSTIGCVVTDEDVAYRFPQASIRLGSTPTRESHELVEHTATAMTGEGSSEHQRVTKWLASMLTIRATVELLAKDDKGTTFERRVRELEELFAKAPMVDPLGAIMGSSNWPAIKESLQNHHGSIGCALGRPTVQGGKQDR